MIHENNLIYFLETVTQGSEILISQLILWIYLHKGHRYELRPPVSLQPVEQEWSKKNIIPLKLCSFAEGSEIIFANSLCGFTFARAIDMNLEPPFLCNRSGKNYSWKQFDLFLGNCNTRFWNDISQLILWIYLHKGHRYELRPPVSLQPFRQKCLKQFLLLLWNCVVLQKVLK